MIEPVESVLDRFDRRHQRQYRAAQHDHRQAEGAGRGDLSIARLPAAVFCDDDLDAVLLEQRALVAFKERTSPDDIRGVGNCERRIDRIDAADEIMMLRRAHQRSELLAAERNKDPARRASDARGRIRDIAGFDPTIAIAADPWRAAQRQVRSMRALCRASGIVGNRRSIGMGCIDQRGDSFVRQIISKTLNTAKSADAHRHRLRRGRSCAAREREGHGKVGAGGELCCKLACLRRAAENQDASHVCC